MNNKTIIWVLLGAAAIASVGYIVYRNRKRDEEDKNESSSTYGTTADIITIMARTGLLNEQGNAVEKKQDIQKQDSKEAKSSEDYKEEPEYDSEDEEGLDEYFSGQTDEDEDEGKGKMIKDIGKVIKTMGKSIGKGISKAKRDASKTAKQVTKTVKGISGTDKGVIKRQIDKAYRRNNKVFKFIRDKSLNKLKLRHCSKIGVKAFFGGNRKCKDELNSCVPQQIPIKRKFYENVLHILGKYKEALKKGDCNGMKYWADQLSGYYYKYYKPNMSQICGYSLTGFAGLSGTLKRLGKSVDKIYERTKRLCG